MVKHEHPTRSAGFDMRVQPKAGQRRRQLTDALSECIHTREISLLAMGLLRSQPDWSRCSLSKVWTPLCNEEKIRPCKAAHTATPATQLHLADIAIAYHAVMLSLLCRPESCSTMRSKGIVVTWHSSRTSSKMHDVRHDRFDC